MNSSIVYFHGKCPDGFCAAAVAWTFFKENATYIPCEYNDTGPDLDEIRNKDVFILDFHFNPDVMEKLQEKSKSLTILDHHKTAKEKLNHFCSQCHKKTYFNFDLKKSGAMLAWDYFYPNKEAPFLVKLIQDRDLWSWELPSAKALCSRLDLEEFKFSRWGQLLEENSIEFWQNYAQEGQAIEAFKKVQVKELLSAAKPIEINGFPGVALNLNCNFIKSLAGEMLLDSFEGALFSMTYRVTPDMRIACSLRTKGFDASSHIAEKFGGGGHPQACGLTLSFEQLKTLMETGRL